MRVHLESLLIGRASAPFPWREKCMPQSILARMPSVRVLGKSVCDPFLRVNEWIWSRLPSSLTKTRAVRYYGNLMHSLVKLRAARQQYHGTFFLRNRPELELIRVLLNQQAEGSTLRISVLACSNGAEVYSFLWTIRSARPDLKVIVNAVDISDEIVEIAEKGVYPFRGHERVDSPIFERLTEEEMQALFDKEKDQVAIKSWIKEGIRWQVADAGDPELAKRLGRQDIVVANRFLCHMSPPDAEKCLRSLASLVAPGGYLFVSGIDLDIRTKVAIDLGWTPVPDLLEEIHNGDPSVRRDWPWRYWGLEPLNPNRRDWKLRYASVFQLDKGA
jgi:SAM-dependent methyltransferase